MSKKQLKNKMSKKQLKKFFHCRQLLFKTKLKLIKKSIKLNFTSKESYYKDIASINLDFGRQTGSSYFLHEKLHSLIKSKHNSVVIFPTADLLQRQKKFFSMRTRFGDLEISKHIMFITVSQIKSTISLTGDFLFVENYECFTNKEISVINTMIYKECPKMVIYL